MAPPPSSLRGLPGTGPRARAQSDALPPSFAPPVNTPLYSHASSYRSLQMELLIYSPSVKMVSRPYTTNQALAVFSDQDIVSGKVILDPSCQVGRLSVTIEGAFLYSTEKPNDDIAPYGTTPAKRKHVFFSSSKVTQVAATDAREPRSTLREVFVLKRRPSGSNIRSLALEPRAFPFAFELPRSKRSGEEMPPTFCSSDPKCAPFEVVYQISVTWESADITENPSFLEIPIILHPDTGFHSLSAVAGNDSSWLEIPLKTDRPIAFRCAVTLPTSVTFSRASSIPYFVVFTTTPRSGTMAREIAADATISISIFSQITITETAALPITPPITPLSESSSDSLPMSQPRTRLLRRVRSRTSPWSPRAADGDVPDAPLPRLPTQTAFSDTQTIHSSMFIGFPKRPRHQQQGGPNEHPTLESQRALPDGLHKDKIQLRRDMLPTIDWAGISVKYYMDISVLFGQDEVRGRVPLRMI
ncbi:unnamed protein product [Mycena citricolor]|uniref:Uncharacterized protein n=1 Tax=Mycena citricolor TaxID=2018698 RepID=A0AAD2Q0B5_9AGAR|nr:unnamed protein product [Mycena citricolor]